MSRVPKPIALPDEERLRRAERDTTNGETNGQSDLSVRFSVFFSGSAIWSEAASESVGFLGIGRFSILSIFGSSCVSTLLQHLYHLVTLLGAGAARLGASGHLFVAGNLLAGSSTLLTTFGATFRSRRGEVALAGAQRRA